MRRFKVTQAGVGQRADIFLAGKYPEYSRSALERLFDEELVRAGGKAVKAGHKIQPGEVFNVDDARLKTQPAPIDLPVIYEDEDVAVIDKPAGTLTHSKGALNDEATVATFIKSKITDRKLTGNRAGIVHRLDRGTSGLMITAKNAEALQKLQKQFSTRKAKKSYLAVVEGQPQPAEAVIDAPIERNPRRPQTFRAAAGGKAAQTHYKTLKNFSKGGQKYTLLELNPATGRTHQLRVHLKYLGHPIAGDNLYGRGDGSLLLHASELELTLPNGQRQIFTSKMPVRIKEFIDSGRV